MQLVVFSNNCYLNKDDLFKKGDHEQVKRNEILELVLFTQYTLSAYLNSAELYDPNSNSFELLPSNIGAVRINHTATSLQDGRILITGGYNGVDGALSDATIYDPGAKVFTKVGNMNYKRNFHTATLLPDGTVLILGGSCSAGSVPIGEAEIFNPSNRTFSIVGNLNIPRCYNESILLNNGKVLIVGGERLDQSGIVASEIYDPIAKSFSTSGNLDRSRRSFGLVKKSDGTPFVIGGYITQSNLVIAYTETYNTGTGLFSTEAQMNSYRRFFGVNLLGNNKILINGGSGSISYDSNELYDPVGDSFAALNSKLTVARSIHTSTLLNDGRVIVVGGHQYETVWPKTDIFNPTTNTNIQGPDLHVPRYGHTANILPNGQVLIVGGRGRFL